MSDEKKLHAPQRTYGMGGTAVIPAGTNELRVDVSHHSGEFADVKCFLTGAGSAVTVKEVAADSFVVQREISEGEDNLAPMPFMWRLIKNGENVQRCELDLSEMTRPNVRGKKDKKK